MIEEDVIENMCVGMHERIDMITIISMVNDEQLYKQCIVDSTQNYKDQIEYVPLHNVTHPTKAYNQAIDGANHNIVVCCHQDIVFKENFVESIRKAIQQKPKWGVFGLAGTTFKGYFVLYNFHPKGRYTAVDHKADETCRVMTIDCLCIILDRRQELRFDEEFKGWHFYGEDIALQGNESGLGAYVIPCRCHHLSSRSYTSLPEEGGVFEASERMRWKWEKYRPIFTTVGTL